MDDTLSIIVFTTVMGLATVFAVLTFLWGVMSLMKLFTSVGRPKKADQDGGASDAAPAAEAGPEKAAGADEELTAVLAAAAAYSLGLPAQRVAIRSAKPLSEGFSAWRAEGIRRAIGDRIQ